MLLCVIAKDFSSHFWVEEGAIHGSEKQKFKIIFFCKAHYLKIDLGKKYYSLICQNLFYKRANQIKIPLIDDYWITTIHSEK